MNDGLRTRIWPEDAVETLQLPEGGQSMQCRYCGTVLSTSDHAISLKELSLVMDDHWTRFHVGR